MGLNLMGISSSPALSPLVFGSIFLMKNGIRRPRLPLAQEFEWTKIPRAGSNLRHLLLKLSCSAVIYYYLWKERNCRILRHKISAANVVMVTVASDVRAYVSSWRKLRKSDENRLLCLDWNISYRVIELS